MIVQMKSRRAQLPLILTLLLMFASVSGLPSPAAALTAKSKPAKTSLTSITVVSASQTLASVKVTFAKATTHSKSPILASEVIVGNRKCTAAKSRTSCVVAKVKVGVGIRVKVRSKNKNGWGPWSAFVAFEAKKGATWSNTTDPSAPTTTLPPAKTDLGRSKVIGTTTVKLSKVEALKGAGVGSAAVRAARAHALAAGDVVFKTSGVVAYAQATESSRAGSKLLAVTATGEVSDVLDSGSIVIREFFSSPNGKVYVVLETKAALTTGGSVCLLAEINTSSGVPTCVDSALDYVSWNLGGSSGSRNRPVQFDTAGNLYYSGTVGSTSVLRKYSAGSTTDLLNDNIQLHDFIVLPDGAVIVAGTTTSSSASWVRRIAPTGGLKTLASGRPQTMRKFADGNVYVGLMGGDSYGFRRYLTSSDALEEKYWISGNTNGVNRDAYFLVDPKNGVVEDCSAEKFTTNTAFCGWYGTAVSAWFDIAAEKTFGVAGLSNQNRALWQYYPKVGRANVTSIANVAASHQFGANIILSGVDSKNVNVTSMYDTATGQETVVLDGTSEIEIYSLSYSSTRNAILFTGLRFADNKYVVGEVSLG